MDLSDLRTKRIAVFTVESPPSFAGAGLNAYEFAKFLSEFSAKTSLCHLNYNSVLPSVSYEDDLEICRLAYYNSNIFTKLYSFIPLLFRYYKIIRSADLIFVYSAYLIGYQFIIFASARLNKKIVFRSTLLNGDDIQTLLKKPFPLNIINRLTLNGLTLYFAINSEFSKRFHKYMNNRIPVFESFQGVNTARFKSVTEKDKNKIRHNLGINQKELIIISVGFLLKRKGYHHLFNELSKLPFQFKYIVLGEYYKSTFHRTTVAEINEMNMLVRQGKDMLDDKIHFAGPVRNIEEYIQSADIFLHGSAGEGTPNVILEALACGIPVIVKKLPGLSALIENKKNAIEFENFNDLPHLIKDLTENDNLKRQLSIEGKKTITENYTFEKVAVNLMNKLYAQ